VKKEDNFTRVHVSGSSKSTLELLKMLYSQPKIALKLRLIKKCDKFL